MNLRSDLCLPVCPKPWPGLLADSPLGGYLHRGAGICRHCLSTLSFEFARLESFGVKRKMGIHNGLVTTVYNGSHSQPLFQVQATRACVLSKRRTCGHFLSAIIHAMLVASPGCRLLMRTTRTLMLSQDPFWYAALTRAAAAWVALLPRAN